MRRLGFLSLAMAMAVVMGLAPAGTALSQPTLPSGFAATSERTVGQGVEVLRLERSKPNIDAYVARVNAGSPAVLKAVSANDKVPHDHTGREDPSDMCRRIKCTVAVNADFWDDAPIGGVIIDHRMLRSPNPAHPQLTVTNDGKLHSGPLDWSGVLRPNVSSPLAFNGVNVRPNADDLVLFTRDWGERTAFTGGVELVLTSPDGVGTTNAATRVDLVGIRPSGAQSIPANGAVLHASGAFIAPLQDLWARVAAGSLNRRAELRLDTAVDAAQSVGANPVLLHDGRKVFPKDAFAQDRHPRTLFGWNALGEVFMVAIDGRQRDSLGMNLNEASDFLLGLGATEGVNFDGGGGTTFVYENDVLNDPSDSSERAAVNVLALLAPPVDSPPNQPGTASGGGVTAVSDGTGAAGSGPPAPAATPGDDAPGVPGGPGLVAAVNRTLDDTASLTDPWSPTMTLINGRTGDKAGKSTGKSESKAQAKKRKSKKRKGNAGQSGNAPWSLPWDTASGDDHTGGGDDQVLALGNGSLPEPSDAPESLPLAALAPAVLVVVAGLGAGGVARWRRGDPVVPMWRRHRRYL